MISFIESVVSSFEPRIEGEATQDFDLRRQELATELRVSLQSFDRKDVWNLGFESYLLESYRAGDTLVRVPA